MPIVKLDVSVLYVEDEALMRDAALEALKRMVQTVYPAENGSVGLMLFEDKKPDVIVTDIMMPVMNGLEMTKAIRKTDRNVPVIVMSAYNDIKHFIEAIDAGINQYLVKPVKMTQLYAAIEKCTEIIFLRREMQRHQNEIRENAERLTCALDVSSDGFWDWEIPSGQFQYNRKWTEITGYRYDELSPGFQSWQSLIHPDDREDVKKKLAKYLQGQTLEYDNEYRIRTQSGQWKRIRDRGRVVARDRDGNPLRMTGAHSDITLREAEKTDCLSEEKYRMIADTAPDWEYCMGTDGRYVHMSPSSETITGYHADDFVADASLVREIVHPADRPVFDAHRENAAGNHAPGIKHSLRFRIITKSGETRWVEHTCLPVYRDDGTWIGLRANNRDITDSVRCEQELRKSHDEKSLLLDTMEAHVCFFISPDICGTVNRACADFFGLPKEAMENRKLGDFLPGAVAEVWRAANMKAFKGGVPVRTEEWIHNRDGAARLFAVTRTPGLNSKGEVEYVVCVATDITESRQAGNEGGKTAG